MAAAPIPIPPGSTTPQTAPLSQGARVANTFFAPSKTFSDLGRSASWWVPWLLISIVSLFFIFAMDRQVGFEQITRNEMSRSPEREEQFDKLPAEQRAQQIHVATNFTRYISYATPLIQLI